MGTREERIVTLTVISASDLKKKVRFGKQSSYAVAYIYHNKKQTTKIDNEGGLTPTWNSQLVLEADEELIQQGRLYITVEIYSHGICGSKIVGTSKIPVSEIAKEGSTSSEPQYMDVEVVRPSGKTKGMLNVSVALGEKRTIQVYKNRGRRQGRQQQYPPKQQNAPQQASGAQGPQQGTSQPSGNNPNPQEDNSQQQDQYDDNTGDPYGDYYDEYGGDYGGDYDGGC